MSNENKVNLEKASEIKAYIYQQLAELEDFLTTESTIEVLSKNANRVIKRLVKNEEVNPDFKAKFCYEISVEENGSRINAYGLANNEYDAIKIAKDKMLSHLISIQNEVISTSDHLSQINQVMSGNNTLH